MTAGLPVEPALAFDLPVGHHRHKLLELVSGKVRADPAQTPGYVFAHCFLTESVDFFEGGVRESVLV